MKKTNKNIVVFSHLLVWLVLVSIPYILSYGQEQDIHRIIAHFWIPIAFYAVIFYLNFFVLIDRLLFSKKMLTYILINVALITVCVTLKEQIEANFFSELITKRPTNENGNGPPFKMILYVQVLSYLAPLLFSIALKTTQRWVKTENERKEAANIKLKSELQHLHYQLQPHFFFNSLNNIYALVDLSPAQAKSSIHRLSKLMRYMLYETNVETIPLTKEIDFMKKYIELMKLRVSDKTTVHYSFPSQDTTIKIAPLMFISLIENAFKHGVSASKESTITIQMTLEDTRVLFSIQNDNLPKKTDDKSGSGIGLTNIKKQLALRYPNKSSLTTEVKDHQFIAELQIETS